jgi:hypothetical protein
MYVVEEGVGRPPAMFFDGDGVYPIQLHGHGSACPEGVAADTALGVSKLGKASLEHSPFEYRVDVSWGDLGGGTVGYGVIGTDGGVVVSCVGHDMGNSACKGFDGAGMGAWAVVADALAPFPIFLVGNAQGCMGGPKKLL